MGFLRPQSFMLPPQHLMSGYGGKLPGFMQRKPRPKRLHAFRWYLQKRGKGSRSTKNSYRN